MEGMEGSSLNVPVCRCCSAEGSFKDIKASYRWMGEEEVYGDMLRECFDVTLSCTEQGGICEVCITQLRNAANFKKQVLRTEDQFKKHLQGKPFKTTQVKEEMGFEENDSDDMDNVDDEDYVPDFDVPIKNESDEEKPAKKRSAKATSTRSKKSKGDDVKSEWREKYAVKEEIDDIPHDNERTMRKNNEKQLTEMQKQWHNLSTLLECSNATPFKDRNDAGYVCSYCYKPFPSADVLRVHINDDHVKEKPFYKPGMGIAKFVVFLDIVNLKCTLCDFPMDTLKNLAEHLVVVHGKQYYLEAADYFQPYKLSNEQQITCCICNEIFRNMKFLIQHMNEHYRNFICTTCGAGFVNSDRLNRHELTHVKKSSYPCPQCGLVFPSEFKKKAHLDTYHKGIAGVSVCQICKAKFKNFYQKTRHMATMHDAEGVKCDMCQKQFYLKSTLLLHMKNVHLKEKSYECSVCSMSFFTKNELEAHTMETHPDERKFKCEVCGKGYATQKSQKKHLKKCHGIVKKTPKKAVT